MNELYLSLGTNIGNTVANMHRALLSLSQLPKTGPLTVSSGWITAPVDAPPQNDFLNLCCDHRYRFVISLLRRNNPHRNAADSSSASLRTGFRFGASA